MEEGPLVASGVISSPLSISCLANWICLYLLPSPSIARGEKVVGQSVKSTGPFSLFWLEKNWKRTFFLLSVFTFLKARFYMGLIDMHTWILQKLLVSKRACESVHCERDYIFTLHNAFSIYDSTHNALLFFLQLQIMEHKFTFANYCMIGLHYEWERQITKSKYYELQCK